jgi:hypothetical protein
MTVIGKGQLQPRERWDFDADFATDRGFPDGDYIVSAAVTVAPLGPTVTCVFPAQSRVVKVWFSGGTNAVSYKVTVLASSNDGRIREVELLIKVKED